MKVEIKKETIENIEVSREDFKKYTDVQKSGISIPKGSRLDEDVSIAITDKWKKDVAVSIVKFIFD